MIDHAFVKNANRNINSTRLCCSLYFSATDLADVDSVKVNDLHNDDDLHVQTDYAYLYDFMTTITQKRKKDTSLDCFSNKLSEMHW